MHGGETFSPTYSANVREKHATSAKGKSRDEMDPEAVRRDGSMRSRSKARTSCSNHEIYTMRASAMFLLHEILASLHENIHDENK
eukprot:scaffold60524_cov33-Tisochrysis_lutea.AAC.1